MIKRSDEELLITRMADDLPDGQARVLLSELQKRFAPPDPELQARDTEAISLRNTKQIELLDWVESKYPRTEKDGSAPGIYLSKPVGFRVIWSVKWASGAHGCVLTPSMIRPLECCVSEELLAESYDVLSRGLDNLLAADLGVEVAKHQTNGTASFSKIITLLAQLRINYPECTLRGDLFASGRQMMLAPRRHWDTQESLQKEYYRLDGGK